MIALINQFQNVWNGTEQKHAALSVLKCYENNNFGIIYQRIKKRILDAAL